MLRPSKAAARLLKVLRPVPKTCHAAVSKPNRNSFVNREAPWQSKRDAARAAVEGCAVLKPSKAAARLKSKF